MNIEFEGRTWTLDTGRVTLKQARAIQEQTGLSVEEWEKSLLLRRRDDDRGKMPLDWLDSMASLYWLMRVQSGDPVDYEESDFDVFGFFHVYVDTLREEIDAAVAKQKREDEEKAELVPFPPAAPVSPEPASPTDTTPLPPAYRQPPTVSTRPGTSGGYALNTSSSWPASAT